MNLTYLRNRRNLLISLVVHLFMNSPSVRCRTSTTTNHAQCSPSVRCQTSTPMPKAMPDRMSEDMPNRMPNRMPKRMLEEMPDRMSEGIPDRMLEDTLDRISYNVPDRNNRRYAR